MTSHFVCTGSIKQLSDWILAAPGRGTDRRKKSPTMRANCAIIIPGPSFIFAEIPCVPKPAYPPARATRDAARKSGGAAAGVRRADGEGEPEDFGFGKEDIANLQQRTCFENSPTSRSPRSGLSNAGVIGSNCTGAEIQSAHVLTLWIIPLTGAMFADFTKKEQSALLRGV
jgi:hypothetical protein